MKKKHTRRKWGKKQIKNLLVRYERSGKNKREFCDLEGISYTTFGNWSRRKGPEQGKPVKKGFVQVHFDGGSSREPVAELFLGHGRTLKFYFVPDAGFIKSVLA